MENNDLGYTPGQWNKLRTREPDPGHMGGRPAKRGIPVSVFVSILCILLVACTLLTYVITAEQHRDYYGDILQEQQDEIAELRKFISEFQPYVIQGEYQDLALLQEVFKQYSYYHGTRTEEEIMADVLKAYAAATGDRYAEYYTAEEYADRVASNKGDSVGIGISVVQTFANVNGIEYPVFQIIAIFKNSPAAASQLRVGDCIYAIHVDGEMQTVAALGGYTSAMTHMRGEKGSTSRFAVLRHKSASDYEVVEMSIVRDAYVSESVNGYVSTTDPTIGVVHLSEFNLTTPGQFKEAVNGLKQQGVTKFVFDLRNNPGGDLQSIKAVLSYFLNAGDLILSAINKEGKAVQSYYAEAKTLGGDYAPCSVAPAEVGMYRDLDMVVLCNGNTASAAEVFTATMRDYGICPVIGETTFGKGIMQSELPLSLFGDFTGYVKMTTYAYVTKCGITYHDIGITPDITVSLSKEAQEYNIYVLPESMDDQLQAAFTQLNK